MTKEAIIEFKDFSFQYFSQAEPTLQDLNLRIYPGEKILIVGPSGSGKSTLGHCLNGLIPFSYPGDIQGSLKIKGQESRDLDIFSLSKVLGTVLQDPDGQFVGLTVGEDIAFVLENDNMPLDQMKTKVSQAAQLVDMGAYLGSSPFELSGGQKQRTALAGVMVNEVEVLLYDEPLANLDPETGKRAIEIIDQIHREAEKTTIIIEHRLEDVLHRPVDRILLLDEGRLVADLHPHQLLASSLLAQHGIREPLYLTALKYAGVPVEASMKPAYLAQMNLKGWEDQVRSWYQSIQPRPVQAAAETILSLKDLSFSYDGRHMSLDRISLDIQRGEMLALVGRNGAGKSTLAKVICGFEKEDGGQILLAGEDIRNLSIKERAQHLGLVLQNPNQMISKQFVREEVALGLEIRGLGEEEIQERVARALEVCGLSPFAHWPISALSFGQKKRVTIAAILALDPQVLILDEPTAGQDYKHYTEIMDYLEEINQLGITIILITHDMHLMLEYTPRTLVLTHGKLLADTESSVVLTDPRLVEEAKLKETSLFHLAQAVGIEDETGFVRSFIQYEHQEAMDHEE